MELDQFLNNNIEEFKDYRSFIEDIWQEEILLMNTNKISSFGEDSSKIKSNEAIEYSYLFKPKLEE